MILDMDGQYGSLFCLHHGQISSEGGGGDPEEAMGESAGISE